MPSKFGKVDASKRPGCVIMKIPHPGYYQGLYAGELEAQLEQECDGREESDKETQPIGLRLTASDYHDIMHDCVDWRAMENDLSDAYVQALDALLTECCGFKTKLHYESMKSPKEYNFTTDRLFVDVPKRIIRKFWAISRRNKHKALCKQIARRFTSRDGFSSYYSNDLESWLANSLENWDHNELETLLLAILDLKFGNSGCAESGHDFGWAMYYRTVEDDSAFMAFQAAVDWARFDRECVEKREEMLADMRKAADDAGEEFVEPTFRDLNTPDMFDSQ